MNTNTAELYSTLLHEWFAHGVKWAGVIEMIRGGESKKFLPWVVGQGHTGRELGEHKAFASVTDAEIEDQVKSLKFDDEKLHRAVAEKLRKDRDRYSKNDGSIS